MSAETSPSRRGGGRKAQPVRVARSVEKVRRLELIGRRDRCLDDIAQLRNESDNSSRLADKAMRLLTQHWSASSWHLRTDILRSAEWLIGVGKNGAAAGDAGANMYLVGSTRKS